MEKLTGLQKAITRLGGLAPAAAALRVTQSTLMGWLEADGADLPPDSVKNPALEEAIKKAGSSAEMARRLGVTYQAVLAWKRNGFMPARRAQQVELEYGVNRQDLISPRLRSSLGLGEPL